MKHHTKTDPRGHRFPVESRPYGGTKTLRQHVQAKCACGFEQWLPLSLGKGANIERTTRRFEHHGWRIGKRRQDDNCPTCAALASVSMFNASVGNTGLHAELAPPPEHANVLAVPPEPLVKVVYTPPAEPIILKKGASHPPIGEQIERQLPAPVKPKRGPGSNPATGWTKRPPEPDQDGLLVSQIHIGVKAASNAKGSARLYLKRMRNIIDAVEGRHYRLHEAPDGVFWTELPRATWARPTPPPAAAKPVDLPINEEKTMGEPAIEPRQASPADRMKIMEALEVSYDRGAGYKGDGNDAALAEQLKVPRIWVSEVRDLLFGPEVSQASGEWVKRAEKLERKVDEMETKILELGTVLDAVRAEALKLKEQAVAYRRKGVL